MATIVSQPKTETPAAKKEPVKGLEIRMSLLETVDGVHTKHVAITITDPDVLHAIVDILEEEIDLAKIEDASTVEIAADETAETKTA